MVRFDVAPSRPGWAAAARALCLAGAVVRRPSGGRGDCRTATAGHAALLVEQVRLPLPAGAGHVPAAGGRGVGQLRAVVGAGRTACCRRWRRWAASSGASLPTRPSAAGGGLSLVTTPELAAAVAPPARRHDGGSALRRARARQPPTTRCSSSRTRAPAARRSWPRRGYQSGTWSWSTSPS